MSKLVTNDTTLHCFIQYAPNGDQEAFTDTCTLSFSLMDDAEHCRKKGDPDVTEKVAKETCENFDQYHIFMDIANNWKDGELDKFIDHFDSQGGWTGFESDKISVCIALTPELAQEGFDSLYQYL